MTSDPQSKQRAGLHLAIWGVAYLLLTSAIVLGLFEARRRTLAALDTPAAREEWQAWKAETERAAKTPGAVQRRVPKSIEPPALVLMRDHFVVVVLAAVTIASCLFAFLMIAARGAARAAS